MTPRIIGGIDQLIELWEAKRAFLASPGSSFDAHEDWVFLTMVCTLPRHLKSTDSLLLGVGHNHELHHGPRFRLSLVRH
jgi:hypothetical protein